MKPALARKFALTQLLSPLAGSAGKRARRTRWVKGLQATLYAGLNGDLLGGHHAVGVGFGGIGAEHAERVHVDFENAVFLLAFRVALFAQAHDLP